MMWRPSLVFTARPSTSRSWYGVWLFQQAAIRVSSVVAMWHSAELWCFPLWTISR